MALRRRESIVKLSEMQEPKYKFIDDTDKAAPKILEFDPWELSERIAMGTDASESPESIAKNYDNVRHCMGYPTSAEVAAADEPKPRTLTRGQCVWIQADLAEFISKLESTKKISALKPK
jgi:hypothetical protein